MANKLNIQTSPQNSGTVANVILIGTIISLNIHIRKEVKSQINNASFQFRNKLKKRKVNSKQEQ